MENCFSDKFIKSSTPFKTVRGRSLSYSEQPHSVQLKGSDSEPVPVPRCDHMRRRMSTGSKASPGRLIPSRKLVNFDVAHFMISRNPVSPTSEEEDIDVFADVKLTPPANKTRKASECRKRLACLSEGASEESIFRSRKGSERYTTGRTNSDSYGIENTYIKFDRKIPRHPERILDLPHLEDNFFTHTVYWTAKNKFLIQLRGLFYICNDAGTDTHLLGDGGLRYYNSVISNPKGDTALAGLTGMFELWDLSTSRRISTYTHQHKFESKHNGHTDCRINCLAWSPVDDNIFNSGCRGGQIDYFDRRCPHREATATMEPPKSYSSICTLKYSPSGLYLASGQIEQRLQVFDVRNPKLPYFYRRRGHCSAIRAVSWYPMKNRILASGGGIDDKTIKLWDIHTGEVLHEQNVKGQVCDLLWSPLTDELVSSQSSRGRHSVTLWTFPEMELLGGFPGHTGRALHLCLSPCNQFLATGSADETLRIWKLTKPTSRSSLQPLSKMLTYKSIR